MGGISSLLCVHHLPVLRTKRYEPCVWEEKSSDALMAVFLGHKVFKQKNNILLEKTKYLCTLLLPAFASVVTCIFFRGKDLFFTRSNLMF